MDLAKGKEGGIEYRVYLDAPNWIAEVSNGYNTLTESWHWAFEPRCGIDVQDRATAEDVLDKLIKRMG